LTQAFVCFFFTFISPLHSSSCESDLSFEITFRLIPWEVVGSVSHAAQCVYVCVITHKRTCSSGRTQAFYLTFLSVRKYEHKYKAFSCQSAVAVDNKKMDSKDVTRFFFSLLFFNHPLTHSSLPPQFPCTLSFSLLRSLSRTHTVFRAIF